MRDFLTQDTQSGTEDTSLLAGPDLALDCSARMPQPDPASRSLPLVLAQAQVASGVIPSDGLAHGDIVTLARYIRANAHLNTAFSLACDATGPLPTRPAAQAKTVFAPQTASDSFAFFPRHIALKRLQALRDPLDAFRRHCLALAQRKRAAMQTQARRPSSL